MRLRGRHDLLAGRQLTRNPQCLEIGHRPATGQVPEMRLPTDHPCESGDGLLLHPGGGTPAVQRVVVRVDPESERVGKPRDRVRRLEHLPRVKRMEVGEVVLHPLRDLTEHLCHRGRVDRRALRQRQLIETASQPFEHFLEQGQCLRLQHGSRHVAHRQSPPVPHGRHITSESPCSYRHIPDGSCPQKSCCWFRRTDLCLEPVAH